MKAFPVILVLILIFCSSILAQIPDSLKYKSVLPKDFQLRYLEEVKAILIDVREFFEFKKSRLKDAVNIPSSGNIQVAVDSINREYALYLYCTTGFRSKRVAKTLYDQGFHKLYSLDGGIVAWKKEGLPVDKKRLKRTKE
jgi:rhodanese-related sulfurtransferase